MPGPQASAASPARNDERRTTPQRRVLIVGARARGQSIARGLLAVPQSGCTAVGFTDDGEEGAGGNGLMVLGRSGDALSVAREYAVDEIVVTHLSRWQQDLIARALRQDGREGPQVTLLRDFHDGTDGHCQAGGWTDLPSICLAGTHVCPKFARVKRCFDIAFSLAMLVLTAPVVIVAATAIILTSEGPWLFRQTRVGQYGTTFTMYKLRTMVRDAERDTGPVFAQADDVRVTPVGRLLRRTHTDELPQLWNVLRGEMSLIGPRPERPEFSLQFVARIPGYARRLAVRPGITGLAQVCRGYLTGVQEKLQCDLAYLSRTSLWQELHILVMTVRAILSRSGM